MSFLILWSFPGPNGIKTFDSDMLHWVEENLLKVRILIRPEASGPQMIALLLPKNTYTSAVSGSQFTKV